MLGPLRCFGYPVFFTQNVVFPFVKAHGARRNVFFVVELFGYPNIGDSASHSVIRAWPGSKPFVRKETGCVIVVRIDKDHFDP